MSKIHDPSIRLPDGQVIRMPKTPEYCEFALPGNAKAFPGGEFWAFHDPQTATGAIYYLQHGTWAIEQPVAAALFWTRCEILGCTDIAKASSEAIAQELAELLSGQAGLLN